MSNTQIEWQKYKEGNVKHFESKVFTPQSNEDDDI